MHRFQQPISPAVPTVTFPSQDIVGDITIRMQHLYTVVAQPDHRTLVVLPVVPTLTESTVALTTTRDAPTERNTAAEADAQTSAGMLEVHKSQRRVSYCVLIASDARGIQGFSARELDHFLLCHPEAAVYLRDI